MNIYSTETFCPSPLNQNTVQTIDTMLVELNMTKDELRQMIEALLGLGAGEVSVEESISVNDGEDQKQLDECLNETQALEFEERLDVIERLRKLEVKGHVLTEEELAMMFASEGLALDSKTLQIIENEREEKKRRRLLSMDELGKLKPSISRMEVAAQLADMVAASGDANVQRQLLGELSKQFLPKDQELVMGKDNQLYVQQKQVIKQITKDTVKRLLRLDYTSDLKRMFEEAQRMARELRMSFKSANWDHNDAPKKQLEDELEQLAEHEQQEEGHAVLQTRAEAYVADEKVKKAVEKQDYLGDLKQLYAKIKRMMKRALKAEAPQEGEKKGDWNRDGDKRDLGEEQHEDKRQQDHTIEKPIELMREEANQETEKDQKKLKMLDHQQDVLKSIKAQNAAIHGAKESMQQAEKTIENLSLEDALKGMEKDLSTIKGGKSAEMKELQENLKTVNDFKEKSGRERT